MSGDTQSNMQYNLFDSIVVPNKSLKLRVPYIGFRIWGVRIR